VKEIANSSKQNFIPQLKRKMTFDSSVSPIKNHSPNKPSNKDSIVASKYRTIFTSKKQSIQLDSLSPEPVRSYRLSASPNRRTLYWQSYLLESKDNFPSKASGLISKTLKIERD
jgi:hypothetical protein